MREDGVGKVEVSNGVGGQLRWRGRSTKLVRVAVTEKEGRGKGEKK